MGAYDQPFPFGGGKPRKLQHGFNHAVYVLERAIKEIAKDNPKEALNIANKFVEMCDKTWPKSIPSSWSGPGKNSNCHPPLLDKKSFYQNTLKGKYRTLENIKNKISKTNSPWVYWGDRNNWGQEVQENKGDSE